MHVKFPKNYIPIALGSMRNKLYSLSLTAAPIVAKISISVLYCLE